MVALVTGGSSGIGRATAERLAARGHRVYELSRRGADFSGVTHLTGDVTDEASVEAAVKELVAREGRLDMLVCNAGYGISGAVELTETEQARRLFDVNFFGAVRCIHACAPHLRESRGHIVCLSSVAAPVAIPFQAYYSCTKAAINDLVLALRSELRPLGVSVSAVMPGDVKTGFTDAREKGEDSSVYGGAIERAVGAMERDERGGMPPEKVAKLIVKVLEKRRPAPLYTAGGKYKLFVLLSRLLPARLCSWIVGKLYG